MKNNYFPRKTMIPDLKFLNYDITYYKFKIIADNTRGNSITQIQC